MNKGEKNLIPVNMRTKEEQRKIASMGGKASAEARRKRKTLKEELLLMLEDENIQKGLAVALIKEATEGNNAGSVRGAFETIRDTIGEKPVEKIVTTDVDEDTLQEVSAMVEQMEAMKNGKTD